MTGSGQIGNALLCSMQCFEERTLHAGRSMASSEGSPSLFSVYPRHAPRKPCRTTDYGRGRGTICEDSKEAPLVELSRAAGTSQRVVHHSACAGPGSRRSHDALHSQRAISRPRPSLITLLFVCGQHFLDPISYQCLLIGRYLALVAI